MDAQLRQAFSDFEEYLAGSRAPALAGHSLAQVVSQDPRAVASWIVRWALAQNEPDPVFALVGARNKVFDVFFYRVVKFARVFSFFDTFEKELVDLVPEEQRAALHSMLARFPWRELRPIGRAQRMEDYALAERPEAGVTTEGFNDELYRNATHQILSADRRYTFADASTGDRVRLAQDRIGRVFDGFVALLNDPDKRREILLANAADRDAVYEDRKHFQPDHYLCQLADLACALLNDGFPEHGAQIFDTAAALSRETGVGLRDVRRFQERASLVSPQRLGEYSATKTGAVLLRGILPLFDAWQPEVMINRLMHEPDRRERRLLLSLIEAHGPAAYPLVVESLEQSDSNTPWYFVRNLAYLLSRMVTSEEELRTRAIAALEQYLRPDRVRQLNLQTASALGFIGNDPAVGVLTARLVQFGREYGANPEATELCQKIIATLIGTESERALDAALDFCLENELLPQFADAFGQVSLPPLVRQKMLGRVRSELRKRRITLSLIGDSRVAASLLAAFGGAGYPDVDEFCQEIVANYPETHPLAVEAAKLLKRTAPPPRLSLDRTLHRLLATRDLAQVFCHTLDAGTTGLVEAMTRDGVSASVELKRGEAIFARVPRYIIEREDAFYWTFLLEGRDLAHLRYTPLSHTRPTSGFATPMRDLLREALFQRGEIRHILGGVISPDSRFRRRDVHQFYTQFGHLDAPRKYEAVWDALANTVDVAQIQSLTQLNRHDVYRTLLYFLERDMIAVDPHPEDGAADAAAETVTTLGLYLERLSAQPVRFQALRGAAEACGYLETHARGDAVLARFASALKRYFADAYLSRRVLSGEDIALCARATEFAARYAASRAVDDAEALAGVLDFSFSAVRATAGLEGPPPAATPLEILENIEAADDAFDSLSNVLSDDAIDALLGSLDSAIAAKAGPPPAEGAPAPALTEYEELELLELFSQIASSYVKPFKDFVRELDRNHKTGLPTSASWLEFVEPSIDLLLGAARKIGYAKLASHLERLEAFIAEQRRASDSEALPLLFCERVLVEHHRLAAMLPTTFALDLPAEALATKMEGLVVKFILKQIPELSERDANRILLAGLNSFERFIEVRPDELAHAAGIDRKLAERVFLKFYQFEDLYLNHERPSKHAKFVALFEIGLGNLKELHGRVEQLSRAERVGKQIDGSRKVKLMADRQRALFSLFTLLCIKGQHDLIERLQLSVFDERLRMLDDYFAGLVSHRDLR